MMRIKLFENFDDFSKDKVNNYIKDILIELVDKGFNTKIELYGHINICFARDKEELFKFSDVKEEVMMVIDYVKELGTYIGAFLEYEVIKDLYGSKHYVKSTRAIKYDEYNPLDDELVVSLRVIIINKR